MAKLSAKERNKLPKSKFAEPKSRKYPIEDASHAKNALARVSQQENKGNISNKMAEKVRAKAKKVLRGKKK